MYRYVIFFKYRECHRYEEKPRRVAIELNREISSMKDLDIIEHKILSMNENYSSVAITGYNLLKKTN